jgi:hypothetical protein
MRKEAYVASDGRLGAKEAAESLLDRKRRPRLKQDCEQCTCGTVEEAPEKFIHGQGMEDPGLKPFTFCNDLS